MSDSDELDTSITNSRSCALQVSYCPVCTLPHEFCQYGPSFDKCRAWLQHNKPDLLQQLYPQRSMNDSTDTDKLTSAVNEIKLDDDTNKADKKKKKAKKSGADDSECSDDDELNDSDDDTTNNKSINKKQLKSSKTKTPGNILIGKSTRSKNKYITTVRGLDGYSIVLKDAAKLMSKKFACMYMYSTMI